MPAIKDQASTFFELINFVTYLVKYSDKTRGDACCNYSPTSSTKVPTEEHESICSIGKNEHDVAHIHPFHNLSKVQFDMLETYIFLQ